MSDLLTAKVFSKAAISFLLMAVGILRVEGFFTRRQQKV